MDDPGQLAKLEPVIERFESGKCFDHLFGHLLAPAWGDNRRLVRKEPEDALLPEATCQLAHGFRVRMGFLGPLGSGTIFKEYQGANHLIAPLDVIDKVELQLGKIRSRFHPRCAPLYPRMVCWLHSDDTMRRSGSRSW
jgi:hypothetical protein